MIMKIKLGTVLDLNAMLKAIIDNTELKIDSLLKFKLLGILKNIEIPVNNFEAVRNEKIREYGKENDEGNIGISADDTESMEKFTNDLNEVINSDVEVNIQKLKAVDVFDKGLPAEYLVGLYPIIDSSLNTNVDVTRLKFLSVSDIVYNVFKNNCKIL